jgi:nucleoprotein TPR
LQSEYQALQEKLRATQDELTHLTAKYSDIHKSFEAERIAWTNDKRTLEDTIVDMSTSEKNSENDRTSRETEVRQQEERAKVG